MYKLIPSALIAMVLAFACLSLSACGAGTSSGNSDGIVAEVGNTPITKAAVNHWMATLAGGDYHQVSHAHPIPAGLVSEPPNYGACVAHLESAAASSPSKVVKLTGLQLLTKCRKLYQALKIQATSYLVSAQWLIDLAREEGVTVTEAEILQLLSRIKASQFPTEAEFREYLASTRASLSDELFVVKLDLLGQKIERKIEAGGKQTLTTFIEAGRRWTAKASCRPGYVVEHCKEFTSSPPSSPRASVLIEQVAAIATGICVNVAACNEQ